MESWEAGGRGRRLPLWVGQLYGPPEGHPAPRDVAGRTASDQQADTHYAAPHCSRLRGVGVGWGGLFIHTQHLNRKRQRRACEEGHK